MFDFHCHILPGIDDGASCWEESLEMAEIAANDGVKTIVATPHFAPDLEPAQIKDLVDQLNNYLQAENLPLTIIPGTEAYLEPELVERLKAGRVALIADTALLVELPFNFLPLYTDEVIFQLMVLGYRVVLAHPERNAQVMKDPELIFDWVSKGVLVQINTGSLLGKFGSQVQQTAEILVKANLVHFLGSDAHSSRSRRPNLAEAAQRLRQLTPKAREICETNAHLLLLGKLMPQEEYRVPVMPKQPWWKRLLG